MGEATTPALTIVGTLADSTVLTAGIVALDSEAGHRIRPGRFSDLINPCDLATAGRY